MHQAIFAFVLGVWPPTPADPRPPDDFARAIFNLAVAVSSILACAVIAALCERPSHESRPGPGDTRDTRYRRRPPGGRA